MRGAGKSNLGAVHIIGGEKLPDLVSAIQPVPVSLAKGDMMVLFALEHMKLVEHLGSVSENRGSFARAVAEESPENIHAMLTAMRDINVVMERLTDKE